MRLAASMHRALPSVVLGPVLRPPCVRQRPLRGCAISRGRHAGARQDGPPSYERRTWAARASGRAAARAASGAVLSPAGAGSARGRDPGSSGPDRSSKQALGPLLFPCSTRPLARKPMTCGAAVGPGLRGVRQSQQCLPTSTRWTGSGLCRCPPAQTGRNFLLRTASVAGEEGVANGTTWMASSRACCARARGVSLSELRGPRGSSAASLSDQLRPALDLTSGTQGRTATGFSVAPYEKSCRRRCLGPLPQPEGWPLQPPR